MIKKIIFCFAAVSCLSGCSTFLMKDCKQQGDSQYYHCKRVDLSN